MTEVTLSKSLVESIIVELETFAEELAQDAYPAYSAYILNLVALIKEKCNDC